MNNEDLIQKHFSNTHSEQEKVVFNDLFENSADFKLAVEEYEDLNMAFKIKEKEDLKAHLNSLSDSAPINSSSWFKNKPLWLAIASCLIIGLFFILKEDSSDSIYGEYFDVYPNVYAPVVRGENNAQSEAFRLYENQNYKEASKALSSLLKDESNPNIEFFYAMSLLNQGKYDQAKPILNELKSESFDYLPEVYWYSALVAIKLEEYQVAKTNLELLQNSESSFKRDKIEILLNEINKALE